MKLEKPISFKQLLDSDNVAALLNNDDRQKIVEHCHEMYLVDDQSRKDWIERRTGSLKTALQVKEDKTDPWPGCANMRFPMLAMAVLNFAGRADKIMVKNGSLATYRPSDDGNAASVAKCKRRTKYLNWLLADGGKRTMVEFMPGFERLLHVLPILDTVFKKTMWDSYLGRPVSEIVLPQDLVVNNTADPDSEPPRATHIIPRYWNEVIGRMEGGAWLEDKDVKSAMNPDVASQASGGVGGGELVRAAGRLSSEIFLEQHTWIDMDGDEYEEPVIVTWHAETKKLMRITRRFEADDVVYDRKRADEPPSDDDDGDDNECGEIVSINVSSMFTKFELLPSFDGGYYGNGFGGIGTPINDAIDTGLNQLLDAATLANSRGGFLPKTVRLGKGQTTVGPNEWLQTEATADELRGIMPFPVAEPSQTLFNLVTLLMHNGDRLMNVTNVQTGDTPTAGVPLGAVENAVEQGSIVYGSVVKRLYRALRLELCKIDDLIKRHTPLDEYLKVVGDKDQAAFTDLDGNDYDVTPVADLANLTTEQQRSRNASLMGTLNVPGLPPQIVSLILMEHFKFLGAPELADQIKELADKSAATPPAPDPLLQAQAGLLQAQTQLAQVTAQKTGAQIQEIQASIQKMAAEIQKIGAQIQIAPAEAKKIDADAEHALALARNVHLGGDIERDHLKAKIRATHLATDMTEHRGLAEDLQKHIGGVHGQGQPAGVGGSSGDAGVSPTSEYNP